MKKLIILLIVALITAGFLAAPAQNNISLHEKYEQRNTSLEYQGFETSKLPALKKANPEQDRWEPDTVHIFSIDSEIRRLIFQYNSQGFVKEYTEQLRVIDSWENAILVTYTYDSNNNILANFRQDWQNNSWVNSSLVIYTYDSNNNMLTYLRQGWENNSWVNAYQITRTYDYNNNILIDSQQIWKGTSWVNSSLTICTYDSNNNMLTKLSESNSLETYTYDSNNNMLTFVRQYWMDDSWRNIWQSAYTYDSNNNILTELSQSWKNNSWENAYLTTYTCDSNNNELTKLMQKWENNSWVNGVLNTHTYNSNNNMLTELVQNWGDNISWWNSSLTTYTYDSSNNLLTKSLQRWINDSWVNSDQYLMTYDENSNGTSTGWWKWVNESWQPWWHSAVSSFITFQLYYNNMQSNFYCAECHKMTASYKKVGGVDTGIADVKATLPVEIHSAGKTIYVNNQTGKKGVVSVYGINGVKIAEQTMAGQSATLEIPVRGFYLVSVKAGNEKPVTEKIIVR